MASFRHSWRIALSLLLSLLTCHAVPAATARLQDVNEDGKDEVVLENEYLFLVVDPARGGQGVSLRLKEDDRELIMDNAAIGGLFCDHDARQIWPGEMLRVPYQAEIIIPGPGTASAAFSATFTGKWGGTVHESLKGLEIVKMITLQPGARQIQVTMAFRNPTNQPKLIDYWAQQIFKLNRENQRNDIYYRPTSKGILRADAHGGGQGMVTDPAGGWSAAVDPASGWAAACAMDYNYVKTLYDCLGSLNTIEWMYERMAIPAGQTWTTNYYISFARGFQAVSYASSRVIADIRQVQEATGARVVHLLASPLPEFKPQQIFISTAGMSKARVFDAFDVTMGKMVTRIEGQPDPVEALGSLPVPALTEKATTLSLPVEAAAPAPRLVFVRLTGKDWQEAYECGLTAENAPLAYTRKVPLPRRVYLKPKNLDLQRDGKLDVLFVRESWFGVDNITNPDPVWLPWKVEEAVKSIEGATLASAYYQYVVHMYRGEVANFPASYEEMLKYDVVVLQAGDVDALGGYGREMLRDFVEMGGGLLVLGGYCAYGAGRHPVDSPVSEVLPVMLTGPFDMKRASGGIAVLNEEAPGIGPLLWTGGMSVFWYHQTKAKPGADVLMTIGGHPLLVSWRFGDGRVLAFTGTTLTISNKGVWGGFWESPHWTNLLKRMLVYVAGDVKAEEAVVKN
ncbi:MAG: glutamine amidotransferase [Armatimonadota bacterium]